MALFFDSFPRDDLAQNQIIPPYQPAWPLSAPTDFTDVEWGPSYFIRKYRKFIGKYRKTLGKYRKIMGKL